MTMDEEMKAVANDIRNELVKDGLILEKDGSVLLSAEEARIVRKVLGCVNTLYTVIEPEYTRNKIDDIITKLRGADQ